MISFWRMWVRSDPTAAAGWPNRSMAASRRAFLLRAAAVLAVMSALVAAPEIAHANWLTRIGKEAGEAGSKVGKTGLSGLDTGVAVIKALPETSDAVRLAAKATPEGHWTFANRDGATFTAADADEMGRVVKALAPDAADTGKAERLALYLDPDSVFKHHDGIKDLPQGARLHVTVGRTAYRLVPSTASATGFAARMRANLDVAMSKPRLFEEAIWQLSRRLNKADIRVVALDVNGADTLRFAPQVVKGQDIAKVDRIKPDRLADALSEVRGQTVLLKGRIAGDAFVVTPTGGQERRLSLSELTQAAGDHDVNLVFLQSSAGRQPGGRNWLWQTVEVEGLKTAVKRATYADFLNALAEGRGPFLVRASEQGRGRVMVEAKPEASSGESFGEVVGEFGEWLGQVSSEVTGNVVSEAVTASLNSKERQQELDWRIVPGVPSVFQFIYLGSVVLGVLAWSTARQWWRYVWKRETLADYPDRRGYYAARGVKFLAFLLVFLPIVALPALMVQTAVNIWWWVMAPVRMVQWLFGKQAAGA